MVTRKYAAKTRGRPFQPGNPGKPKGARHQTTLLAERLMASDAEAVVAKVINAAKAGDMVAARIILDRISPARRSRAVSFALPKANDAVGVLAAHAAMIDAVAIGAITIDEGTAISQLLCAQLRVIESTATEARLRAVEGQLASQAKIHEGPQSW